MNRFLIAIALALMSVGSGARAASASDDTHATLDLCDAPDIAELGQEAGPPAAGDLEFTVTDVGRDALGDVELDAISGASGPAVPIEREPMLVSMPGEVYEEPLPARQRPYRKQAMDRHRASHARPAADTPGRLPTGRRARE